MATLGVAFRNPKSRKTECGVIKLDPYTQTNTYSESGDMSSLSVSSVGKDVFAANSLRHLKKPATAKVCKNKDFTKTIHQLLHASVYVKVSLSYMEYSVLLGRQYGVFRRATRQETECIVWKAAFLSATTFVSAGFFLG